VNFPLEGLYDVRLFIATEKGCTSIASDQVRVEPRVQHFVPNAFTPDRKGPESNELFMPVIDRNVQEYSFMVFNRWGEKVFSSTLPQEGWNALRHGKPLAAGSYAWQLRYYTLSGREVNDSGVVLLIR
jgi:gliding motility-associated-like protein